MNGLGWGVLVLVLGRWAAQVGLERLNCRHARNRADTVPDSFKHFLDQCAYARSAQYTLAKGRLEQMVVTGDTAVLLAVLFSGLLPWSFDLATAWLGESSWARAGFLCAIGGLLTLPGLPFAWYAQFRVEEQFGFNKTSLKLWCLDHLKGGLLAFLLGYPLLVLLLKLVEWAHGWWWLYAWLCMMCFQGLMLVLAPVLILPLFNRFTALPPGPLRDRLLALAQRTGFHAQNIQVMDGSKRSSHSNAFFTGFGRWRKIVLFDTLIEQLAETELAAVLAHEIGHYQKKHVLKMFLGSAAALLVALFVIAWLANQTGFYRAFGFQTGGIPLAFLLFALLSGPVTFWFSPLANYWSRRHEFQADAYAAQTMGEPQSLIQALRILNQKNLSNLTPHPFYSAFYYSHPTLLEREQALGAGNLHGQSRNSGRIPT